MQWRIYKTHKTSERKTASLNWGDSSSEMFFRKCGGWKLVKVAGCVTSHRSRLQHQRNDQSEDNDFFERELFAQLSTLPTRKIQRTLYSKMFWRRECLQKFPANSTRQLNFCPTISSLNFHNLSACTGSYALLLTTSGFAILQSSRYAPL